MMISENVVFTYNCDLGFFNDFDLIGSHILICLISTFSGKILSKS